MHWMGRRSVSWMRWPSHQDGNTADVVPSSQNARFVSSVPLVFRPWRSRYYIVDAGCDALVARLRAAIAADTRWRGRIGTTGFVIHRLHEIRLMAQTTRLFYPPTYVFVGQWRSCDSRCLLCLAYRPNVLVAPLLALFAGITLLFLALLSFCCIAAGYWLGALGVVVQGTISFAMFNGCVAWAMTMELNELLQLIGARPYSAADGSDTSGLRIPILMWRTKRRL